MQVCNPISLDTTISLDTLGAIDLNVKQSEYRRHSLFHTSLTIIIVVAMTALSALSAAFMYINPSIPLLVCGILLFLVALPLSTKLASHFYAKATEFDRLGSNLSLVQNILKSKEIDTEVSQQLQTLKADAHLVSSYKAGYTKLYALWKHHQERLKILSQKKHETANNSDQQELHNEYKTQEAVLKIKTAWTAALIQSKQTTLPSLQLRHVEKDGSKYVSVTPICSKTPFELRDNDISQELNHLTALFLNGKS